MIAALTGNEIQIGSFQITVHDVTRSEEWQKQLDERLEKMYQNETAHRVVRISYQRGSKVIACNSGHEELLRNELVGYIEEKRKHDYYPFAFILQCFVTYSSPKLVNKETPAE